MSNWKQTVLTLDKHKDYIGDLEGGELGLCRIGITRFLGIRGRDCPKAIELTLGADPWPGSFYVELSSPYTGDDSKIGEKFAYLTSNDRDVLIQTMGGRDFYASIKFLTGEDNEN